MPTLCCSISNQPMKSPQGSVEEQDELEEPVYEEPVYEEVGAFPELTKDTAFSSTWDWSTKSDTLLTSQRSFDQTPVSKASMLAQEDRIPDPPPGPPSKSSPQARGSLEEQLLQELNNLILRKGEPVTCPENSSQPTSPQSPSPSSLPPETSSLPTQTPCTSNPPSSQPLT